MAERNSNNTSNTNPTDINTSTGPTNAENIIERAILRRLLAIPMETPGQAEAVAAWITDLKEKRVSRWLIAREIILNDASISGVGKASSSSQISSSDIDSLSNLISDNLTSSSNTSSITLLEVEDIHDEISNTTTTALNPPPPPCPPPSPSETPSPSQTYLKTHKNLLHALTFHFALQESYKSLEIEDEENLENLSLSYTSSPSNTTTKLSNEDDDDEDDDICVDNVYEDPRYHSKKARMLLMEFEENEIPDLSKLLL